MSLMTVISGTPNSGLEPETKKERKFPLYLRTQSSEVMLAFPSCRSSELGRPLNTDPVRLEGARYGNLVNSLTTCCSARTILYVTIPWCQQWSIFNAIQRVHRKATIILDQTQT